MVSKVVLKIIPFNLYLKRKKVQREQGRVAPLGHACPSEEMADPRRPMGRAQKEFTSTDYTL